MSSIARTSVGFKRWVQVHGQSRETRDRSGGQNKASGVQCPVRGRMSRAYLVVSGGGAEGRRLHSDLEMEGLGMCQEWKES